MHLLYHARLQHLDPTNESKAWIYLYDSEMLDSFMQLTKTTNITFQYFDPEIMYEMDMTYQIHVGQTLCATEVHISRCAPPVAYMPFFIWTKEGFKKQI